MDDRDPRVGAYFETHARWQPQLSALRAIVLAAPLTEGFKWRAPCYMTAGGAAGGNVVALWAMRDCCALAFFKGALLRDPARLLVPPGGNSRAMRVARFTDSAVIADRASALADLLGAAIAVEEAGLKIDMPAADLPPYPPELETRLAGDAALRAAFEALTPGRRRGYILHFAQARQSATRAARIARHAPRILAGKGMHDR